MTVTMTLRNPLVKDDLLDVFIEPNNTQLAKDWQLALFKEIQRNSHLEKNYCWHGWPNGPRDLEYLTKELSHHSLVIWKFNELGVWQSMGLPNIKIETLYTPESNKNKVPVFALSNRACRLDCVLT